MTRKNLWLVLAMVAALSFALGACGADDGGEDGSGDTGSTDGGDTSDGSGDATDSGADSDTIDPADYVQNPACASDQGGENGDWDCDGVPNAIETANGTGWQNADSDGDGLCDGPTDGLATGCLPGEDLNGDGVVNNGESDPNDSNDPAGGVNGPIAKVCNAERQNAVQSAPATAAGFSIAHLGELQMGPMAGDAHTFAIPERGVYGYILSEPVSGTTDSPLKASLQLRLRITGSGIVPTPVFENEFRSWQQREAGREANNARRDEWAFSFGAPMDPAALRDDILGAVSGATVNGPDTAPTTCTNVVMHQMIELTDDDQLLTVGVLACADDFDEDETRVLFSDLTNTTTIAPITFKPDIFLCESLAARLGGGLVDFIFVLDNSGSMLDEQENVVNASQEFLAQLSESTVDWRIGVTTTDAYCRLESGVAVPECVNFLQDYSADPDFVGCAGLRGPGFLDADEANLQQQFADTIQRNAECVPSAALDIPDDVRASGPNLCGHGYERGLESALAVVRTLTSPAPTGTICEGDPAYSLRPEAQRVVIFLTDEEDEDLKANADTSTSSPLPADAGARVTTTQALLDQFNAEDVDVRAFAIAGDEGAANGGTCAQFSPTAGTGAEYGLSYIDVARGTEGSFGTICNDDFAATIEAIIALVIGQVSNYALAEIPISSSLAVAVGDQVLGRTGLPRFEYDAATNGIVLFGINLAEGQTIAVSYKRWDEGIQ